MTRTPPADGQTWFEAEATNEVVAPQGPAPRYTRVEQIGVGGMGTVHSAIDTELGRIVALKEAHDDPRLAARLEREARLTAALDHPGIVTVHDAGRGRDGRPWYTMRLVRGESLGALLARQDSLTGRLTLLRHLLDAAQAIAWAHSHTTVHRDLKPENIMVGEMGETQVVDWGLAVPFGTETRVAGTPQYMSPQQAIGAPADPRDDVWSLGVVLYELLTASNPRGTGSVAELLARATVPIPPLPPGVPPELAAIVGKALAMDPADRYPTARELAADLARWIDGRPVLAHHYTPRELLVRAVRAYQLPLLVAGVALGAFLVMLGLFTWRTSWERDRATAAEADARHALAGALAAHARSAFSVGAWPEAEVLAAEALVDHEDPEARGVLAGLAAIARPTLLRDVAAPTCIRARLGGETGTILCDTGGTSALWEVDPPRERWKVEGPYGPVSLGDVVSAELPGAAGYVLLDTKDGHEVRRFPRAGDVWQGSARGLLVGARASQMVFIGVEDGQFRPAPRCVGNVSDARVLPDGRVLSVCAGGHIVVASLDGAQRWDVNGVAAFIGPVAWDPVHDRLLAITQYGDLWAVPRVGEPWRVAATGVGTVTELEGDPSGRLAVVAGARGGVEVWDVEARARVMRLPYISARDVAFTPQGNLVELGARYREWALPAAVAGRVVPLAAGASAVAVAPDGNEATVGLGSGSLIRWSIGTGRTVDTWDGSSGAVKSIVYDGDGVVWSGGERGMVRRTLDGRDVAVGPGMFLRRATMLAGGIPAGFSNDASMRLFPDRVVASPVGETTEIGPSPRRMRLAVAGSTGDVVVVDAAHPEAFGSVRYGHDAVTATVSDDGSIVVTGGPTGLHAWFADGSARWSAPHPEPYPVDLGLSGDGRWVAAAGLDGATRVYRTADGVLAAVLRGHTARLSAIAFAVDRPILATVGWDAELRIWDLSALDLDAKTAAERARTWWRMDRDAALAAVVR